MNVAAERRRVAQPRPSPASVEPVGSRSNERRLNRRRDHLARLDELWIESSSTTESEACSRKSLSGIVQYYGGPDGDFLPLHSLSIHRPRRVDDRRRIPSPIRGRHRYGERSTPIFQTSPCVTPLRIARRDCPRQNDADPRRQTGRSVADGC